MKKRSNLQYIKLPTHIKDNSSISNRWEEKS